MKFFYSKKFKELFKRLPGAVQEKFVKQLTLLFQNPRHPSLQIKKIQGYKNIWEGRVDYHYRFTFNWEDNTIIFRVIGLHDEVLKKP